MNRAGAGDPDYQKQGSGMRFMDVAVPASANVLSSYLTFTAKYNNTNQWYSYISAEKTANPATFGADKAEFDARFNNHTTSRIDYSDSVTWTAESQYQSPDISDVISEVIEQQGWESGNSIVLFWEDFDDRSSNNRNRRAHSYDNDPAKAPVLHIEYEQSIPEVAANVVMLRPNTYATIPKKVRR